MLANHRKTTFVANNKVNRREGTHRSVSPEVTLDWVSPFLPVMGITRIANVTGLDTVGIPVVMVCRPNSRSISVSQGKGYSLSAAKASGVMESIESYHAERIVHSLKIASYEELRYTHNLVDVEKLPRLSSKVINPNSQIAWIEGHDILNECSVWVPFDLVSLNFTAPFLPGHGSFVASSNGLASGNVLAEAISHGISEVIERDAATLWRVKEDMAQDQTQIDTDTITDPICKSLLEKFYRANVIVAVWEITSDIGVPAFLCRIMEPKAPPYNNTRPASGMGCHPCREIALSRALTEAAQSRLTFISGARDDMPRKEYENFLDPQTYEVWLDRVTRKGPHRNFSTVPTKEHGTINDDVNFQLSHLTNRGIEQVIVVDLTKEEFGIPVTRVIIPGLEGIDQSADYILGPRALALLDQAA